MEIPRVSTSNSITLTYIRYYPILNRNLDLGTVVEYRKALLASRNISTLDKPHIKLENLLRRFLHESNPDDAGSLEVIPS
ncbi:hypothetical protein Tco_1342093 [Tanacetum coccineum]